MAIGSFAQAHKHMPLGFLAKELAAQRMLNHGNDFYELDWSELN